MARITGLGGVFVAAENRQELDRWYKDVLGLPMGVYGATLLWRNDPKQETAASVFCHFDADSDYFKPGHAHFMLNFRVDDLEAFLLELKAKGVKQEGDIVLESYGKFAWILDPAGTKIELWQEGEPLDESHNSTA